jgi:hypothetical protein
MAGMTVFTRCLLLMALAAGSFWITSCRVMMIILCALWIRSYAVKLTNGNHSFDAGAARAAYAATPVIADSTKAKPIQ